MTNPATPISMIPLSPGDLENSSPAGKCTLSSGVEIEGSITFQKELLIDGKVRGQINSDGVLTIGENADIRGEIKTKSATVHGKVYGNITTERCELKSKCTLQGDLKAARLIIEEGATFIGRSLDPLASTAESPEIARDRNPSGSLQARRDNLSEPKQTVCIISITHGGFIKRTAVSAFRAQCRGGEGVIGMQTREGATEEEEGDFVEHLFTATTHDYLMFFTAAGRAYVKKVYKIPEMGRAAKGRSIANILELKPDEKIAATIRVQSKKSGTDPNAVDQTWDENLHIVFATQSGIVKKSNLSDYNVGRGGIIAIQIEEGDRLIDAKLTNGNNEIVLITKNGMSLRFHEEQVRDQGRNSVGVWGIRPEKGDQVVAIAIVDPNAMLLVAGENGIGKRTPFDDYRRQSRGGKGIVTMRTGEETGDVVGALTVREADEIMLITNNGQRVRTRVKEIRETGRNTMGVKLMDLRDSEKLQAIAPVVSQAEEEEKAQSAEPTAEILVRDPPTPAGATV
jgi:DNA gyrase/topoisomerase IV subunit A